MQFLFSGESSHHETVRSLRGLVGETFKKRDGRWLPVLYTPQGVKRGVAPLKGGKYVARQAIIKAWTRLDQGEPLGKYWGEE